MLTSIFLATIVFAHGKNIQDDNTELVQTSALVPNKELVREVVDAAAGKIRQGADSALVAKKAAHAPADAMKQIDELDGTPGDVEVQDEISTAKEVIAQLLDQASGIGGAAKTDPAACAISNLALTNMKCSNLGGLGPDEDCPEEIRYSFVTVVNDVPVDLVITNTSTYTPGSNDNVSPPWKNAVKKNGGATIAQINLQGENGGSSVDLTLSFVKSGTYTPVTFDKLYLSFVDFDHLQAMGGVDKPGEETIVVRSPLESFETGSSVSSDTSNGVTTFKSKFPGTQFDNPECALCLTDEQKAKSISLTFSQTDTVHLTLAAASTRPGNGGSRNLLLAGSSALICGASTAVPPWPAVACPPGQGLEKNSLGSSTCAKSNFRLTGPPKCNNLGGLGPQYDCANEIRYSVVSVADGVPFDLVVTIVDQGYYNHATNQYNGGESDDEYLIINVRCGTATDVKFSFMEEGTNNPVTLDEFYFSVLDFDQYKSGKASETVTISSDYVGSQKGANVQQSGNSFTSTSWGTGHDNPDSAMSLTAEQQAKSMTAMFRQKSSIQMNLQAGECGSGRNFLFGGSTPLYCDANSVEDPPCVPE